MKYIYQDTVICFRLSKHVGTTKSNCKHQTYSRSIHILGSFRVLLNYLVCLFVCLFGVEWGLLNGYPLKPAMSTSVPVDDK